MKKTCTILVKFPNKQLRQTLLCWGDEAKGWEDISLNFNNLGEFLNYVLRILHTLYIFIEIQLITRLKAYIFIEVQLITRLKACL